VVGGVDGGKDVDDGGRLRANCGGSFLVMVSGRVRGKGSLL